MAESQTSTDQTSPRQDIVADFPQEIAAYAQEYGSVPSDMEFEPGYYCRWQGRCYIHTRATLPLHAIDDGVGFGLWVEIEPSEFDRYLAAQQNDEAYKTFKTEGFLANSWPGFMDAFGLPVTVRTIRVDEKVYITEVHLDRMRDVLFEVALTAQQADAAMREQILNLVQAWMSEVNGGTESGDEVDQQTTTTEPTDEQPGELIEPEASGEVTYQEAEDVTPEQAAPEQPMGGEQPIVEQVVFEQSSQPAQSDEPSPQAVSPDQPEVETTQSPQSTQLS